MVWRGRDVLLDRAVAVKEIVQPASDETYQRTLREARAAARVKHPGVAAVYDVVSEDGRWYIVMELVEGSPLSQVIDAEGRLPPPVVADIGKQILEALKAGHAAGVLHRDLKPSNVLITPAGRAVLTDFGIASVAGDPSITRTGIVLGTPGYLAPERAAGEVATEAADLWSLGATLFAAAEGYGPYDSYHEVMAMMVAVISTDPPAPTVGEPLASIISALLSRDLRRRPSTEMTLRRLEAAAAVGPSVAAGSAAGSEPVPTATAVADFEPVRESYGDYGDYRGYGDFGMPAFTPAEPESGSGWQPAEPESGSGWQSAEPAWRTRSLADTSATQSSLLRRGWDVGNGQGVWDGRDGRDGWAADRGRRRGGGGYGGGRKPLLAIAGVAIAAVVAVTVVLLARPSGQQAALASNSVPPALTEQFRVAPVVAADGNPSLFARSKDGHLVTTHFSDGAWPQWSQVPGSPAITGVPGAEAGNGQLAVAVRDAVTGYAEYLRQSGNGSWQAPARIGTRQVTSSVALLQVGGLLEAYARLGDGQLGFATLTGGTWSDWKALGGSLTSAPVASLDMNGNPHVFAVATFNKLIEDVYAGGRWSGIRDLPGNNYDGQPAVGTNPDGRLELYIHTTGNLVVNVWQRPSDLNMWGGPAGRMTGIVSEPAVANENQNRLDIFARAADGSVLHSLQNSPHAGTSWSTPAPVGASLTGAPAVLHLGGGNVELFVRTQVGTIAVSSNADQGNWSSPVPISGTF